jgi:outer membrane protein OmpA-like peptidoglycan-associated protein
LEKNIISFSGSSAEKQSVHFVPAANKLLSVAALLFITIFFSTTAYAQEEPDILKVGVQFNPIIPGNEFRFETDPLQLSWITRITARFGLADYLNGEVGIGYGIYRGEGFRSDNYKTHLYPVDFRLLLKITKTESYPYLMLGAGAVYYNAADKPQSSISPKEVKQEGIAGIAPVGIGFQIMLARKVHLDINAGISFTTTDNLNYYKDGLPPDVYYFAGIGLLFGGTERVDTDKDGLFNDQEKEIGTDPKNPDTDGDGLTDGDEVLIYFTDPLKKDTDGDGLTDGEEINKYKTDPLKKDTDGDGLSDGDEVLKYKTDPLNPDTDGDGLEDGEEVNKYMTDPLDADTDKDGITDFDEVKKYNTDPLSPDTDEDTLTDYEEIFTYKTNPLKEDTDGGSVPDGVEVRRGTDPLDPDDDVLKIGTPVILEGINFEFNSAEITEESESRLEKAYQTLINNTGIVVEVAGHTDDIGSARYNLKLSQARAEVVMNWLIAKGIDAERLSARGYGERKPFAPNNSPENRAKNRRIEFERIK